MSNKLCKRVIAGNREEESIMREVLGGLEEIVAMLSYDPWPGDFEIIAIYPPEEERSTLPREQVVVRSSPARQQGPAEIISYQQIKQRLRKTA